MLGSKGETLHHSDLALASRALRKPKAQVRNSESAYETANYNS